MREVLAVVHALAGDQNRITHSPVMSSEVRCQHLSRQHCGLIIHEFVNRETAMLSSQPNLSLKENTNFILNMLILVLLKVDSEKLFFQVLLKGGRMLDQLLSRHGNLAKSCSNLSVV